MVGPDYCGKTVYLAVLFRHGFVPDTKNRWRLSAAIPAQARSLNRTYAVLRDPDQGFPEGTGRGSYTEYQFATRVANTTRTASTSPEFSPLSVVYLDFPGDIVHAPQPGEDNVFQTKIEDADIVMGLFDGSDVLGVMHTSGDPARKLESKYGNMLTWLSYNHNLSRTPVHFVVTKWDLLEAAGFNLKAVRDRLLEFETFERFVHRYMPVQATAPAFSLPPTHLIPISSIGPGFAEIQGEIMTKTGKTTIEPQDIMLPLALAVCDAIRMRMNDTQSGEQFSPSVKDLIAAFAFVIESISPAPAGLFVRLGNAISQWIRSRGTRLDLDWLSQYRARIMQGQVTIHDERSALESLISDLAFQIAKFDSDHPEALL